MDKAVLPPGDSAALEIVFTIGEFQGHLTKRPAIYTAADSTRPAAFVQITTNAIAADNSEMTLLITPQKFELPSYDTRDSLSLLITNRGDHRAWLDLVDFPSSLLEIQFPGSIPAHDSAAAMIHFRPEADSVSFSKSITIELGDSFHTRYTIPIKHIH
ncbi:MAG: hypothetical protein NT002_08895 [candidate division Zixibacteria bacterium]|nr:hypothetical protein [candidate division Zixibacteria bacterium]